MKKLILLFLAVQTSVLAGTNTWYKPGNYPEDPRNFAKDMQEIKGNYRYYRFESDLRKDKDVLDEFKGKGLFQPLVTYYMKMIKL